MAISKDQKTEQPKRVRRHFNKETYDKVLEAFRNNPGNYQRAAEEAGVHRPTARRFWNEGFKRLGLPPIKEVIAEEQAVARAHVEALRKQERETELIAKELEIQRDALDSERKMLDAKANAIEVRTEEGRMIGFCRRNTTALLASSARLINIMYQQVQDLEKKVKAGQVQMTPKEVIKLAGSLSYITRAATESAKLSLEMERILLGEPTEIIGVNAKDLSYEEAAHVIGVATRALKRAQEKGLAPNLLKLTTVGPGDGGSDDEKPN